MKLKDYKAWEYRKGFRTRKGKMVYGLRAIIYYTFGFLRYHINKRRKIIKNDTKN